MTAAEHTLEALQSLCRARQAVDALWLDFRQTAPSQAQLDALVFGIVVELVGVHDALEHVMECTLESTVRQLEDDPQAMDVSRWEDDHA